MKFSKRLFLVQQFCEISLAKKLVYLNITLFDTWAHWGHTQISINIWVFEGYEQ